jgi:hypothetical protein
MATRSTAETKIPKDSGGLIYKDREAMRLVLWLGPVGAGLTAILGDFPIAIVATTVLLFAIPAFLVHWGQWQRGETRFGGLILIFPAAYCITYTIGSLPLGRGLFGVNPDTTQWVIYGLGLACFMCGALAPRKIRQVSGDAYANEGFARLVGLAGLAGATVQVVNSSAPLLSGNINEARFNAEASIFTKATGLIVGAEQFGLVVLALSLVARHREKRPKPAIDIILVACLILSLLLFGARSFIVLPLLAITLVVLERGGVKGLTVITISIVAFALLTAFNNFRQWQSGNEDDLQGTIAAHHLTGYPLASGIISLQAGPHVFQVARQRIPGVIDYQRGQFFLADGALFLRTKRPPSDHFVTMYVTRRNVTDVGGSPPTVLGGLYIDGGVALIAGGMVVLGFVSRQLRDRYLASPHIYSGAAYGYWGAWLLISLYSYISLKPTVVLFMICCWFGAYSSVRRQRATTTDLRFRRLDPNSTRLRTVAREVPPPY